MIDLLAIAIGVIALISILILRSWMSVRVPHFRWRVAPVNAPPAAFADLHAQAETELTALGFRHLAWLLLEDQQGQFLPAIARVMIDAPGESLAHLQPPVDLTKPNHLVTTLSSRLADGRWHSSLNESSADEFFSTPRSPRRSFNVDNLPALLDAHRAWCASEGGATPIADTSPAAIASGLCARIDEFLDDLDRTGMSYRAHDGSRRMRLSRMLKLFLYLLRAPKRAPKSVPDTAPVPPARQLAMLALLERQRERAPTTAMQFVLLALTTALFALFGAVIWSAAAALMLALALIVHEGGHYLAMRAFGYRHVQMVLLPLLGGVTTGQEQDPNGRHRALVSLAGPLPGIAIGWALLLAAGIDGFGSPLTMTAVIFLALNYLNLLPVPPLDGGHFVQSLWPRGWERVRIVFVGVLVLLGVVLAWALEFWLLLVLIGVQLMLMRGHWRDARVLRSLRAALDLTALGKHALDARLLAAIDADQPTANLNARLTRVLRLRNLLQLQPPRPLARVALLALFLAPFVLPLANAQVRSIAQVTISMLMLEVPQIELDPHTQQRLREDAQRRQAQQEASRKLPIARLLEELARTGGESSADTEHAMAPAGAGLAPVSDAALAAAAQRLGSSLPDGYAQIARLPQRKVLQWREPEQVVRAGTQFGQWLDELTNGGKDTLFAYYGDAQQAGFSRAQLEHMLVIAGSDEDYLLLFNQASDPCCRVLELGHDEILVWPDLHAWLAARHAEALWWAQQTRRLNAERKAILERDAGMSLPELVAALRAYRPGAWPDVDAQPRSNAQIQAVVTRLGELPTDYRALLALGNGLPIVNLLPLEEVVVLDAAQMAKLVGDQPWPRIDDGGLVQAPFSAGQARPGALAIGAWRGRQAGGIETYAGIVLVHQLDGTPLYLDIGEHRAYESLRRLLLERHATIAAGT